jgi:hypothetical protein
VITVLEKYSGLIEAESSRLEKLQEKDKKPAGPGSGKDGDEEGDDEEDEGKLFEKDYLYKMIKLMKSGGKELNFGFGLNTNAPEASKLLLKRKGKPDMLFKMLKRTGEFSNRTLVCGTALADPENGKVLMFRVAEGDEPPQIIKLGRKFLRGDKALKFRKLKVVFAGGKTLTDDEPDTEDEEAGAGGPAAAGAQPAGGAAAGEPSAGDVAQMEDRRKQFKEARKRWVAVRDRAEQDLEVVKDGIRDHYLGDREQFPIAMKKMKELDAIMDHLSDDLRDALDAYVSTPLKQQSRLKELGGNAKQLLDKFVDYVDRDPLLAAIDQKEFADVQIKAPMEVALRDLAKTIG